MERRLGLAFAWLVLGAMPQLVTPVAKAWSMDGSPQAILRCIDGAHDHMGSELVCECGRLLHRVRMKLYYMTGSLL